jgi:hypothetical protein
MVTEPKLSVVGLTLAPAKRGQGNTAIKIRLKQMKGHTHSILRISGKTFVLVCVLNPEREMGFTPGVHTLS